MENDNKSIAKDMLWNTIGNLVYCICQWVITILTVRLCSYEAAGYLSLAMTTSSTFSTISLFSMRNFQVSDVIEEYKDNEYIGSRFITCTLAFTLCCIYSCFSSSPYQRACIIAFMMIRLVEGAVDVLHGINQKFRRYDLIGKSLFLRGVATIVAFLVGILITGDIFISLILTAMTNILAMMIYDVRQTGKLEKMSVSVFSSRVFTLLKKCLPLVVSSFLLSLVPLIPKNAIQALQGNDILGIYSSIASPTMVVQVFAQYAFAPLVPKISVMFNEKRYDRFLQIFHEMLAVFVGFAIVITIGAMLLGRWGLSFLYGKSILEYYPLFMPLIWCTILTACVWVLVSIVTSIRKLNSLMIIMFVGFVFDYVFTNRFLTWFNTNGASYIQIVSFSIMALIMVVVTEWEIRHQKRKSNDAE